MTWKLWLLSSSVLLAASAGSTAAQDPIRRPAPAPYYNQLADIIYPEPPACSAATEWVHLFDAMATQRQGDRRCLPERARLGEDVRISHRRDREQDRMSLRQMYELRWILADVGTPVVQEVYIRCQLVVAGPDGEKVVEEFKVPASAVRAQQPDAAWAELSLPRKVANPECLSRPCQPACGPSGAEVVPVQWIGPSKIPHNLGNVEERSRTEPVPGTAVVRQAIAIDNNVVFVPDIGKVGNGPPRLSAPGIEATADRMTWIRETDQILLEGNVVLELSKKNQPAKILTRRALVNFKDGTYEVLSPNHERHHERSSKPTSPAVVQPLSR